MSLRRLDGSLVSDFATAVAFASANPPIGGSAFAEIAGTQKTGNGNPLGFIYHTGLDKLMTCAAIDSTGRTIGMGMFSLDPGLSLTSAPNSLFNMAFSKYDFLIPGQLNPDTSAQKVYTANNSGTFVEQVNPTTLVKSGGAEWSGPNGDFVTQTAHITGGVGGWANDNPGTGTMVFEGLVNGIPGETLLSGTGVYPDGLILLGTGTSAGTVAGKPVPRTFVWVDPNSRLAIGVLGGDIIDNPSNPPQFFPLEASSSPAGDSSEAPIDGDSFRWNIVQYLPDSDATFAEPKGQLMMQSGQEIPLITVASPGDQLRQYVRLTDFNPFGLASVSGVPTRIHGRIRLTSRALLDVSPIGAVAGADILGNPDVPAQMQFDPLRQRFLAFISSQLAPLGDSTGVVVVEFSAGPDPVIFTSPAARDVPRTADVVTYETFVQGDLGEPVAGVEVAWTLTRRSTEGEVLDASTFPGTSQLVNFPIDEDSSSAAELVIEADSVPLAVTTDYTVNTTTGLVTWVTDQSGATLVEATYNHRATGATPAHGTLLTQLSITDADGVAQTQIAYADDDDLVGTLDALESAEG